MRINEHLEASGDSNMVTMRLCRCGRIVKDRCKQCNPRREHTGTTKERGYGHDHKKASKLFRVLHPFCERCMMTVGLLESNPSEELHHIFAIQDHPDYRMVSDNWLAVCHDCHQLLEGQSAEGLRVRRWSDKNYDNLINEGSIPCEDENHMHKLY